MLQLAATLFIWWSADVNRTQGILTITNGHIRTRDSAGRLSSTEHRGDLTRLGRLYTALFSWPVQAPDSLWQPV